MLYEPGGNVPGGTMLLDTMPNLLFTLMFMSVMLTELDTAIRIRQSANGCQSLSVPSVFVTFVLKSSHHVVNCAKGPCSTTFGIIDSRIPSSIHLSRSTTWNMLSVGTAIPVAVPALRSSSRVVKLGMYTYSIVSILVLSAGGRFMLSGPPQ